MPDYQLGKIYKLTSPSNNLVYYGSTAQKHLSTRIAGHIRDYNSYLNNKGDYISSFEILKCEDYKYELIEEYPCNNKPQLKTRERWYIQNNECVNKYIPGRTAAEYYQDNKERILELHKEYREANIEYFKEQQKEYRTNNKDKIKEQRKEYRTNNKDKIKELNQEYYKNNTDKILKQVQEYREDNEEAIKANKSEKISCECGCEIRRSDLARHKKTQKHIRLCSIEDISVVTTTT